MQVVISAGLTLQLTLIKDHPFKFITCLKRPLLFIQKLLAYNKSDCTEAAGAFGKE